jgi:ribosomal protein S13
MSVNNYGDLLDDARELLEKQLAKLRENLKEHALTHQDTKALLEIAKWLFEMSFIEKDELASMAPEDLNRLKERERKRALRQKYRDENKGQNQGDPKEATTERSVGESSDCP